MKKSFCFIVCTIILMFFSYGQESVAPVVKEHFPIKNLAWDSTDQLFAYQEEGVIFLRGVKDHKLIGTIVFPGVLGFSMYYEDELDVQIIAGSTDGTFAVWSIPVSSSSAIDSSNENDIPPHYITSVDKNNAIDVLTFSENANYVGEHFVKNENVGIHFRLRYTNELVSKNIENYPSPVYSMVFSSDNTYLAAASLDNKVRVWNSDTGKFSQEHPVDSKNRVAVSFIPGTYNLLVPRDSVFAAVIDPANRELMKIQARSPIRQMKLLSDGRRLAILTEENRLEIYRLSDGKHLGYLPSFNVTAVTSFDFNSDDSYILMGHEDGSIYRVAVDKNLVGTRNMPVLRMIGDDEIVVRGERFTESIPKPTLYLEPSATPDDSLLGASELNPLYKGPSHGLEFLVGTTFLPKPHLMNLDLSAGYINNILLHPFYLGAHFTWSLGFPDSNFPHTYQINGETIDSPLLLSFALGVPFGIILTPFESNRDIELSAEVNLGSALHYMWNRKFGGATISSHIYPAFVGSLALGVGWKGFTFRIHGDYNTQLGFMFSMNLGYTFAFPSKGSK